MGDQGHRLEVRGVVGVPVRAADALAVRGQRRHVRVLRETRRGPPRQHLPQRVRVGVHQHPADGRVRRRHPAPRRRVAPRAQRAQLLLVQVPREALRRRRAALPGEPRQRADRQHRREAVLAALPAARVRHRREQVAQRTQLGARAAHRHRPARPLRAVRRIRQPPPRVAAQRPHVHRLRHRVRVRVRPVVAREALRPAHPRPVRRGVARAPEPRRVHERLRQLHRMAVRRRPVPAQPTQAPRQRPRRQVRDARRLRQHQEPRVVRDQVQAPELHRPVPAQPAVPRRALERPRLPAQQRHPVPPPLRDVAHTPPRELPETQVVALVHQRVPAPPLVGADRTHLHLPHHHFGLVESRRHAARCTPAAAEKPDPCVQSLQSPPSR